jgi:hypothetical protein
MSEQKEQEENKKEIENMKKDLERVKISKGNAEKKVKENFELASSFLAKYKALSDQNTENIKELDLLRKEKQERDERHRLFREKLKAQRNQEVHISYEGGDDSLKASKVS